MRVSDYKRAVAAYHVRMTIDCGATCNRNQCLCNKKKAALLSK